MPIELNLEAVRGAMLARGLSAAALARELDVSREAVSNWLRGEAAPRPGKLLRLALALGLQPEQMLAGFRRAPDPVIPNCSWAPVTAPEARLETARDMAGQLDQLVPFLGFPKWTFPPVLKQPRLEPNGLLGFVAHLRRGMGLDDASPVPVERLARLFPRLQAVIVPVLRGLMPESSVPVLRQPDSLTTWVFVELASSPAACLYQLAHVLGHVHSMHALKGKEGERFAEGFAAALLFPQAAAEQVCVRLRQCADDREKRRVVSQYAAAYGIPEQVVLTGARVIDGEAASAEDTGMVAAIKGAAEPEDAPSAAAPNDMTARLFGEQRPVSPATFVSVCEAVFATPVFAAIRAYQAAEGANPALLRTALGIPLLDAKTLSIFLAGKDQ